MLEKDAKKEVLLYLYRKIKEEGVTSCSFSEIVKSIPGSDSKQLYRIAIALRKDGYVDFTSSRAGSGRFSGLSSEAMEFVENNYLQPQTNFAQHGPVSISTTRTVKFIRNYRPTENRTTTRDMSEAPCFHVDDLAKCYANMMGDVVTLADNDTVSMLGIFAPWGRGKSYFFSRVKRFLPATQFNVVEFNAWKYQETPALWAYLFESFYKSKSWWFRIRYTLKRHFWALLLELFIFAIPLLITFLFNGEDTLKWVVGGSSLLAFLIKAFADKADSAIGLIKKYSKGISFASEMGVQAEVEKELERLLCSWIPQRKVGKMSVVLYIDDLDRCKSERMVSVIDSLRTVLENPAIRKRLLVVCSVDSRLLIKAIKAHFHQIMLDENKQRQEWMAQEQLDKLFLCSISLPMLDVPEELEFIEGLSGEKVPSREHYMPSEEEKQSEKKEKNLITASEEEDEPVLSKSQLAACIADIIEINVLTPPPRAIRHIYYRCILAMNILHALGDKMTKEVINQIIQHSYGYEMELKHSDTYIGGYVVDMVVPYEYPVKDGEK